MFEYKGDSDDRSCIKTAEKNLLWLAFGHKGGGSGGDGSKLPKRTTSGSWLDVVVVVGDMSKCQKKTTSGLCLNMREVVVMEAPCRPAGKIQPASVKHHNNLLPWTYLHSLPCTEVAGGQGLNDHGVTPLAPVLKK